MKKLRILFLCTGNSCRSQMAEGWARVLKGDSIEPYSAGVEPHGMNPRAARAMIEAGIDIRKQYSKHVDELKDVAFDYVVTVCDHANETCPIFPGHTTRVHVGFDDPPRLAKDAKSEEEAMSHYRRVRDEIKAYVETLPGADPAAFVGSEEQTPEEFRAVRDQIGEAMKTWKPEIKPTER